MDTLVPVVSKGQGQVEHLCDNVLDELDLLMQQASLVHLAHVACMSRYHQVKVMGIFHLPLELESRAVEDLRTHEVNF